jgi:glycosyltransferase involved in cell wall biosynthesis
MIEINPLVSAIIPVFNRQKYIAEAIDSVLAQTYDAIEIIVVDDGSSDDSAVIVKNYNSPHIRYHYQKNQGISAARNKGVELAIGEFYAFLDSDDLWMPTKIERQLDAFRSNIELDLVFSKVSQFQEPGTSAKIKFDPNIQMGIIPSSMIIKADSFKQVGGFSIRWRVVEFLDWYARVLEVGLTSQVINEPLTKRRIHDSNIGITEKNSKSAYLYVLKESLNRRRNQSG